MNLSVLKKIRVVFSVTFLVLITLLFVDFTGVIPESVYNSVLFLQFIPSLVSLKNLMIVSGIGFIIIIVITLFSGRIYCSFICPLGIFQDVISYFSKKIKKLKRYRYLYQKPLNWLRYGFLGIFIIGLLSGFTLLISLLDPYSIFGRISSGLFRPIVIHGNNLIVSILQKIEVYSLYHVNLKPEPWLVIISSVFFLVLITFLAIKNGRIYCNTVCPVGTLLGLISRLSFLKISINKETCTSCRLCERNCKSNCINIPEQDIDFSRCVSCFNCLTVCPENSVEFKISKKSREKKQADESKLNTNRRGFLAILALILTYRKTQAQAPIKVVKNTATVPAIRTIPVSPPGSFSVDHLNSFCTACHLCISACPTHVLQPSYTDYGLIGFLQPVMDNHAGFCNYDCKKCSEVCPTGAIQDIILEDKKLIQIGKAKFVKENCIVETEGTDCGACAEHCPTKAVRMISYKDNLVIPEVNDKICVGCGACEYACPTTPYRAIYVEGNSVHQIAEKPKEVEQETEIQEDFPF